MAFQKDSCAFRFSPTSMAQALEISPFETLRYAHSYHPVDFWAQLQAEEQLEAKSFGHPKTPGQKINHFPNQHF